MQPGLLSGGSRGVSTVSTETPFELVQFAKRLTVSLQLEGVVSRSQKAKGSGYEQQPLSLHLCACASKGGVVATVHMRMKPPFPILDPPLLLSGYCIDLIHPGLYFELPGMMQIQNQLGPGPDKP